MVAKAQEGRLSVNEISSLHIFDTSEIFGAGLPYDPTTTDIEHLFNITTGAPVLANFFAWIKENKDVIRSNIKQIWQARLEKKFFHRFGEQYDENKYDQYQGEQKALCDHYNTIWQSFETRYLDLDKGEKFHPRILCGMHNAIIFEENLKYLEGLGIKVIRHPKTEVTSLEKLTDGKLKLGFDGSEDLVVSDCILATGTWPNKPRSQSNRYLSEIWPVQNLRKNIDKIIAEEIAQRAAEGNPNREIRIAIEGSSLSAIDVLKTIYQDGKFTTDESGNISFVASEQDGFTIKVDMVSRSGLMQKVKPKQNFIEQFRDPQTKRLRVPDGIFVGQEMIKDIAEAKDQDGKIRLWQVMIMIARAVELGYKTFDNADGNKKADAARDALIKVIDCIAKDENATKNSPEAIKDFLDHLDGDAKTQMQAIKKFFGLELDGANYEAIFKEISQAVFVGTPIDRLKSDLHDAEFGDVGGYLVWLNVYRQIDDLTLLPFLTEEEEIFRFQILDRLNASIINGMPIQSAKELVAVYESGAFDSIALGSDVKKLFIDQSGTGISEADRVVELKDKAPEQLQDRKIIFQSLGELRVYDLVINTRGRGLDLAQSPPLYQSMAQAGLITSRKVLWCDDAEYEGKREHLIEQYGQEAAETMLRYIKQDNGQWFYQTDIINKNSDGVLLDKKDGQITCPNIFMPTTGGILTSLRGGERLSDQFAMPAVKVSVESTTSIKSLFTNVSIPPM